MARYFTGPNKEILMEGAILICWFVAWYFLGDHLAVWLGYRS